MEAKATPPGTSAPEERPTRYWIRTLLILLLLTEQGALGFSLFAPTLPHIANEFNTTEVAWVMTGFTLAGALASPILGKLADVYGKKRMLVVTASIAATGALISALAPVFALLILGRFLSGAGFACMAIGYTLIRDVFPKRLQSTSISIANTGVGAVGVGALFVSGLLIDSVGVRGVFWVAFAFCATGAILALFFVPETKVRAKATIDWGGAGLLALGVFLLLMALSRAEVWGWIDLRTFACGAGGLVVLAVWVAWERRVPEPLIRLDLVAHSTLRFTFLAGGIAYGSTTLLSSLVPVFLQSPEGFALTATEMALWLLLGQVTIVMSGLIVGATAGSIGFRRHLILGATLISAASLLLAAGPGLPVFVVLIWIVFGLGCMIYAAVPNLLLSIVPETERAVGSNFLGVSQTLCGTIVSAIGFAVLAQHTMAIDGHSVVYTDSGFLFAFLVAGGVALTGALVAVAIPRDVQTRGPFRDVPENPTRHSDAPTPGRGDT